MAVQPLALRRESVRIEDGTGTTSTGEMFRDEDKVESTTCLRPCHQLSTALAPLRTLGLAHLSILWQRRPRLGRNEHRNPKSTHLRERKTHVEIQFHLVHTSVDSFFTSPCVRLKARPSSHCPPLPSGDAVLTWTPLHLGQRTLPAGTPLLGSFCSWRGWWADGFLITYWILLKVVDLSNLNHPRACSYSHQEHRFSTILKLLVSTPGAGERGSIPWETTENSFCSPAWERRHPEEPGGEERSLWALLTAFPSESISALLLPCVPSPLSLPSAFFLLFFPLPPSFLPLMNIYWAPTKYEVLSQGKCGRRGYQSWQTGFSSGGIYTRKLQRASKTANRCTCPNPPGKVSQAGPRRVWCFLRRHSVNAARDQRRYHAGHVNRSLKCLRWRWIDQQWCLPGFSYPDGVFPPLRFPGLRLLSDGVCEALWVLLLSPSRQAAICPNRELGPAQGFNMQSDSDVDFYTQET